VTLSAPRSGSIRGRLLSRLGLLFACGMVVLYLAATSYARFAADSSFDRLLLGSAGSITETLSVTPGEVRADIPYAALDMLAAAPDDRVFYRVIGTGGETVSGYGDLPAGPAPSARARETGAPRFFDARYRGEPVRFVTMGREVRFGGRSGWIRVQVGQTRAARTALAKSLTIRALLPILAMTMLAGVVVWLTVRRAVRPLEAAGARIASREAADLSPITASLPSEVMPLVAAINLFMARLDSNLLAMRSFIADAAHQLRTPLTTLLVQLRSAETNKGAVRDASIAAAGQSAGRLARLVDQLLSDAMVTHLSEQSRAAPMDLRRTVEQSLQDSLPVIQDADVRFTTALDAAPIVGDPVMVAEAINNLIHNALKYGAGADGETELALTLTRADDCFLLEIADRGPGVAAETLPQLGDRFRPGPASQGGAGLGLAIARQVMAQHGGTLELANRPDGPGFRAVLGFRAA
jgi:two-component system sensor histidine kinase TctE